MILVLCLVYPIKTDAAEGVDMAADLSGMSLLKDYFMEKGITDNIVPYSQLPNFEISEDYNTILFPTDEVEYQADGTDVFPTILSVNEHINNNYSLTQVEQNNNLTIIENTTELIDRRSADKENPTKTVLFSYAKFEEYKKEGKTQKLITKNGGYYNGRLIDIEIEITDMFFDMDYREKIKNEVLVEDNYALYFPYKKWVTNKQHLGLRINLLSPADRSNTATSALGNTNTPYDDSKYLSLKDSFLAMGSGFAETRFAVPKTFVFPTSDVAISSNLYAFSYFPNEYVAMDFKFRYSDTQETIENFKGVWNWENLNGVKTVTLPINDLTDLYMYNDQVPDTHKNSYHYSLKESSDGLKTAKITGNLSSNDSRESSRLTQLIDSSFGYKFERNLQESTKDKVDNGGALLMSYSSQTIPRISPSKLTVSGKINEIGDSKHEDYHKLKYSFIQTTGNNSKINRDNTFVMSSKLPIGYKFDRVKTKVEFLNESAEANENNSKLELFNVSYSDNDNEITLEAKEADNDNFVGKVIQVSVVANRDTDVKIDKVADRFELKEGAIADGYLNYELGSVDTVLQTNDISAKSLLNYTYGKNKSGTKIGNKVENLSEAKVRHLSDLSFSTTTKIVDKDTNVKQVYEASDFISQIKVDLLNEEYNDDKLQALLDSGKVTVKYKDDLINSGNIAGAETKFGLEVTLTENGVTKTFETTASVYNKGAYIVQFLGNDKSDGEIDRVVINYPDNEAIDLTKDETIKEKIEYLKKLGYNEVNYDVAENNDQLENAYKPASSEGMIIYRVTQPGITVTIPNTATFKEGIVDPSVDQLLEYNDSEDFAIKVKDLRTIKDDKSSNATRNGRGKLEIQAYMDAFSVENDLSKELSNVSLYWNNKSDNEKKRISDDSASPLTIYKNETVEKELTDVNITLSSIKEPEKNRLELEVNKGSNVEAKSYTSIIYWNLIYAP